MCSSGGSIAKTDEALQQAQATSTDVLTKDYSTAFAEQQTALGQETAKLNYIMANPMGYSPAELHSAITSINENTATASKQALGAAAAFAAAHGSADVGGGATGEIAGQIASAAAQSKAQQLSSLTQQNESLKRQNFWSALNGLNSVGSEYGGSGATAISGANSAADTSISAGTNAENVKMAGLQAFGSILSGVGGLAAAGASAYKTAEGG